MLRSISPLMIIKLIVVYSPSRSIDASRPAATSGGGRAAAVVVRPSTLEEADRVRHTAVSDRPDRSSARGRAASADVERVGGATSAVGADEASDLGSHGAGGA